VIAIGLAKLTAVHPVHAGAVAVLRETPFEFHRWTVWVPLLFVAQ
jgi:hypothetical protein